MEKLKLLLYYVSQICYCLEFVVLSTKNFGTDTETKKCNNITTEQVANVVKF